MINAVVSKHKDTDSVHSSTTLVNFMYETSLETEDRVKEH